MHDEEIVRVSLDDFNHIPDVSDLEAYRAMQEIENGHALPDAEAEGAVFLDAYDFISLKTETPQPLWGNDEINAIPAGGLCLLAGRPGTGKTTLILDLACHLAAGKAWPPVDAENERAPTPLPVPRPLRVAIIENEGPEDMFRAKLGEKLGLFPHPIGRANEPDAGCLIVQTWRWGAFSFADKDAHARAQTELDANAIDIVVGDPLSSLGPEGVGSPADTRDFVSTLRPLGLGTSRAFLFLHHFRERVERTEDELARISGAWGGHLDTLVTLSSTSHADQARLAWPKLRWARRQRPAPLILGRIWSTAGFEAIGEEGDSALIEPLVYSELAQWRAAKKGRQGLGWATTTEIAKALERRRVDVKKALEGAPHLFELATGEAARALGAKSNAQLWGLTEWTAAETEPPEQDETQTTIRADDDIPF